MARYVKTGIAGYGPDIDDGDEPFDDVEQVCNAIREELDAAQDMLHEDATTASEERDYQRYHDARELADKLDGLRHNLDYASRAKAPLYANNHASLDATMERIIAENFPLSVDVGDTRRVYVWEAEDDDA